MNGPNDETPVKKGFPTWLKVVLGLIAAFILLTLICGVVGAMWFNKNKDKLLEGGQKSSAEGTEYGTEHPGGTACTEEGLRRLSASTGVLDEVGNQLFLNACLEASSPPASFCEGVPGPNSIASGVKWTLSRCSDSVGGDVQACTRLMRTVQQYCANRGGETVPAADEPLPPDATPEPAVKE